ncbi:hypothetical protein BDY17DRAFT_75646 [Neohortaea acidophila]|uniref:Uncharacterized protein n=1 Tax=Neohortaea acidophila TaxID=245834 RepID=A0A6A6Q2T4_9PEZI|nr:uncharacterized protein BDY17DRAFT_75646 [Neohortaea acidophila]KAF2486341.1 hypothetical protein BDY17DRAFT_75646 [Neohortaea acidophila]
MQSLRSLILTCLVLLPHALALPSDDGRRDWAMDPRAIDDPDVCCPEPTYTYMCCVASCGVCMPGHDCDTVSEHRKHSHPPIPLRGKPAENAAVRMAGPGSLLTAAVD